MAINTRSPYYVTANPPADGYAIFSVYIYEFSKGSADYVIRKNKIAGVSTTIEISELIKDYLNVSFAKDDSILTQDACRLVEVDKVTYQANGTVVSSTNISTQIAFESYSYFQEEDFDIHDNPLMQSNKVIYALADNLVRIPISTYNNPTVTFFNKGEIVGSYSYTRSNNAYGQVEYLDINGNNSLSESYRERVLINDGVYEESQCLTDFFNEFEIGEADEVRISDDVIQLETVKIKVLDECKYEPKKVSFVNKFGVIQDMIFFKKFVEKMNVKKETYKANTSEGTLGHQVNSHVRKDFNVIGNESFTLSSGFLTEDYNEVFKQMLLSEKVWITSENAQILPINVKTSNITYKTSLNDRLVEYTIEFDYSFDTINNVR